jgi:regulator of protease activity HflC (stomatin/prohibitin superfamily)
MPIVFVLGALFLAYALMGLRQIQQWEVAMRFTFGRFKGKRGPGLYHFWPGFQRVMRIDTRMRNRNLPQQMVITRDNVTTRIDAVLYYRVVDPEKAALAVEDFEAALKDRAMVALRDIVGDTPLDELLAHREQIAAKVRAHVDSAVEQWGLAVDLIGLQDIQLPQQMQEVLAKGAIAERDRRYVVIKSQADVESARNFANAARILVDSPGAMELRRFEALTNLSQAGNTKVIFDLHKSYDELSKHAIAAAEAATTEARRIEAGDDAEAEAEQAELERQLAQARNSAKR